VDEGHWLKLYNGSLAQEVMFVSLFHLCGHHLCTSTVLSFPREKGYYWGALIKVMFRSPTYLTFSILEHVDVC
jgi:hypothetical protein